MPLRSVRPILPGRGTFLLEDLETPLEVGDLGIEAVQPLLMQGEDVRILLERTLRLVDARHNELVLKRPNLRLVGRETQIATH